MGEVCAWVKTVLPMVASSQQGRPAFWHLWPTLEVFSSHTSKTLQHLITKQSHTVLGKFATLWRAARGPRFGCGSCSESLPLTPLALCSPFVSRKRHPSGHCFPSPAAPETAPVPVKLGPRCTGNASTQVEEDF